MHRRLAAGPCRRIAALASLAIALPAAPRDVDLGTPDLTLRFDNTLRYNLGVRTDPVNGKMAAYGAGAGCRSSCRYRLMNALRRIRKSHALRLVPGVKRSAAWSARA